MKKYVLENYGWFDDIAEEIRKEYKKPLYETATDMKEVKEIAKDYGKSILMWREIETEEGKRKTAKTMYTIKISGKIHTTHDKRYATRLAIRKEWEEQTKEVNEYNGNLGYDD